MNIYQLLRDLVHSGNRNETWLREADDFITSAETMNLFGTVGGQELASHEHNYQREYRTGRRKCTVCSQPDPTQPLRRTGY